MIKKVSMQPIQMLKVGACNFLFIFLIFSCSDAANIGKMPPPFSHDGQQSLTLVSFNIRVGYGTKDRGVSPFRLKDKKKALAPIIDAIRSCDADIAGLQEVLGRDQARKIAEKLNMNFAYAAHPTSSPYGPWWGVALLSRYPIVKVKGFQISTGRGNSKKALRCAIDVNGRILHAISIHKDKDLTDGGSFKKIMKHVEPLKGAVVLLGDMNMLAQDRRFHILERRFKDSAAAINTNSAREARRVGTFLGIGRIDYVLVDPTYFKVVDAGLVSRQYWKASDHLAFWAKVIPTMAIEAQ